MHSISSRPQMSIHKKLKFPICIQNFNYKFLKYDTPVYTLNTLRNNDHLAAPSQNTHYKDTQYFTAPLLMKERDRSENVMISMICPSQTELVQKDLLSTFDIKTSILRLPLGDLSYHASILHTPLVTIVNSYCHVRYGYEMDMDGKNEDDNGNLDYSNSNEEDLNKNTEYEIFYTKKYLELVQDYESRNTSFL